MRGGGFSHFNPRKEEDFNLSQLNRRALTLLGRYLVPHHSTLGQAALAMLLVSTATVAGPYLLKVALDDYMLKGNWAGLNWIVAAYLALNGAAWFGSYRQAYLAGKASQEVVYALRQDLFWRVENLPLDFFQEQTPGEIMSRLSNDVNTLGELIANGVVTFLNDLVTITAIVLVMFHLQPRLALLTFLTFPLIFLSTRYFGRRIRGTYREVQARLATVNSQLQEDIAGIRVVQSLTREKENRDRFEEVNLESFQANLQAVTIFALFFPAITVTGSLGTALVLWYGGQLVVEGSASIGLLAAFIAYVRRFFTPLRELSQVYNTLQRAGAGLDRIGQYLDLPTPERGERKHVPEPRGGFAGALSLEGITFSYQTGYPVLKGLNLQLDPGTSLALVGKSGAGKTTLVNLLARLYYPAEGRILIDGVNLQAIPRDQLRKLLTVVPQEPFLFATSILENIRYPRPEATDEEVKKAARMSGLNQMVRNLPGGYHTPVGPRGVTLSGGQKQLLALARAFLLYPRIVILDEPTSKLDGITERWLHQGLKDLLKERTGLIISHRPQTLRLASEIAILEGGRITARGPHRELSAANSRYRRLLGNPGG